MQDPVEAQDRDCMAAHWEQCTRDLVFIFPNMLCISVGGPMKLCE